MDPKNGNIMAFRVVNCQYPQSLMSLC